MAPGVRVCLLSLLAVALVAAAALGVPARAEHEPNHRYFVTGTVTNELGERLCGLTVRVADISVPSSADTNRTGVTDGAGRYVVQLHLHDAVVEPQNNNIGDTLLVSVEGTSARTTTTAVVNDANPQGWGQRTVDPSVTGAKGTCPNLLLWAGAGVGVTFGVIGAVWLVRRPRRGGGGSRVSREILSLPGMNRARARELAKSGIKSIDRLGAADPEELAGKTNLTPKEARLLVKRAQEARDRKNA